MKKATFFKAKKIFLFFLLEVPVRILIALFLGVAILMILFGIIIGLLGLVNYGITSDIASFLKGAGIGVGGVILLAVMGGLNDKIKSHFF